MSASEREIRKHQQLMHEVVEYTMAIRRDPQDADAFLNKCGPCM